MRPCLQDGKSRVKSHDFFGDLEGRPLGLDMIGEETCFSGSYSQQKS